MTTDTERQEEQTYETVPERIAAMEATQQLLIEVVRENGRRADENYKALDAKIDSLMRLLLIAAFSLGGIMLAALITLIVAIFIR